MITVLKRKTDNRSCNIRLHIVHREGIPHFSDTIRWINFVLAKHYIKRTNTIPSPNSGFVSEWIHNSYRVQLTSTIQCFYYQIMGFSSKIHEQSNIDKSAITPLCKNLRLHMHYFSRRAFRKYIISKVAFFLTNSYPTTARSIRTTTKRNTETTTVTTVISKK